MLRHGDSKRARFESYRCPRVLFRKRRFYSVRLLLGAIASEAAKQLTSFSGWLIDGRMISQDVHVRADAAGRATRRNNIMNSSKFTYNKLAHYTTLNATSSKVHRAEEYN